MTDLAAFPTDLTESRRAKISRIDRNCRRAFGAAVGFQRANSKLVFERGRRALLKFFGADQHEFQASELSGIATPDISLQKGRRCQKESDGVLRHERPNCSRV